MPEISFDFKRYIDQRRGADDALAKSGAAYAYPGDQRVLRTLSSIRPVTLAVEATVRLQKSLLKGDYLGTTVKVTERQFPKLYAISQACAARLHIPQPTVYVAPKVGTLNAHTFGTNEDAFIVLNGVLVDHLSDEELHFVIGHECGHIQNNHVVYMTALHYLMYSANLFVRWIVTPAVMALQSWSRRAEITCDRAGLLCCGALPPAQTALARMALGSHRLAEKLNMDEYLKQLQEGQQEPGRVMELFQSHPYLPKRVQALALFAQTHYFMKAAGAVPREGEGRSLNWCDAQVKRLLALFGPAAAEGGPRPGADGPAPGGEDA